MFDSANYTAAQGTNTTQDSFHPMRGHVADGTVIIMRNGDRVTLKATMAGWCLMRQDGTVYAECGHNAYNVAAFVEQY